MSFRDQVQEFLATVERPAGLRDYGVTPGPEDLAAAKSWHATLAEHGYACMHWPIEHGGSDASVADQAAFAEECARAGVPRQLAPFGPDMVGPVLQRFGGPAQQRRFLPEILRGSEMWCQLFSEPEAGSDLASVRTTATAVAGGWSVSGQKVWTSGAHGADFGLLLARTGSENHAGLSMFILPMTTPGISVRPLRQMDGEAKFNEVFLDKVHIEQHNLIGETGQGWQIATMTLGRERLSLGTNAVGLFTFLRELECAAQLSGRLDEPLRREIARLWVRTWILRQTWLRAIEEGSDLNSAAFSVLKLMASETYRDIGNLGIEALGHGALARDHPLVKRMLVGHAQTILGGTSEIQRNILAERVLGLPRGAR